MDYQQVTREIIRRAVISAGRTGNRRQSKIIGRRGEKSAVELFYQQEAREIAGRAGLSAGHTGNQQNRKLIGSPSHGLPILVYIYFSPLNGAEYK
ncbi:hypothetical protein [Virgibacillus sediminis]|uniref:Uncharacterized protein n=1 Tax=Virgibacillus sediminis TaxID=202260 RepID=A0ABV7A257_9BACI